MAGNQTQGADNKVVDIYYDHYKDTFAQQKEYLVKRDRLTLFLLIAAIIMIGFLVAPSEVEEKVNTIIQSQIAKLSFDFSVINTGLILVTFWYLLQYYMVVLQIEKMYKYIEGCEEKLSKSNPPIPINREGAYYLKSYPWLKDIADYVFVLGIPVGFIILSILKIINEWSWPTPLKCVDITFLGMIIFFSLLYVSNRKLHEEYFDKKVHPNISRSQRFQGYFTGKTKTQGPES
jgi:hypothetical protein